jgi:predicted PurR-regulated permease PerM
MVIRSGKWRGSKTLRCFSGRALVLLGIAYASQELLGRQAAADAIFSAFDPLYRLVGVHNPVQIIPSFLSWTIRAVVVIFIILPPAAFLFADIAKSIGKWLDLIPEKSHSR